MAMKVSQGVTLQAAKCANEVKINNGNVGKWIILAFFHTIFEFGVSPFSLLEWPDVYTNVSVFANWINQTIYEEELKGNDGNSLPAHGVSSVTLVSVLIVIRIF